MPQFYQVKVGEREEPTVYQKTEAGLTPFKTEQEAMAAGVTRGGIGQPYWSNVQFVSPEFVKQYTIQPKTSIKDTIPDASELSKALTEAPDLYRLEGTPEVYTKTGEHIPSPEVFEQTYGREAWSSIVDLPLAQFQQARQDPITLVQNNVNDLLSRYILQAEQDRLSLEAQQAQLTETQKGLGAKIKELPGKLLKAPELTEKEQKITDLEQRLADVQKGWEAAELDITKAPISMATMTGRKQVLWEMRNAETNAIRADIAVAQGSYDRAFELAKASYEAEMKAMEFELSALEMQINFAWQMSEAQKADYKFYIDLAKEQLETKKADKDRQAELYAQYKTTYPEAPLKPWMTPEQMADAVAPWATEERVLDIRAKEADIARTLQLAAGEEEKLTKDQRDILASLLQQVSTYDSREEAITDLQSNMSWISVQVGNTGLRQIAEEIDRIFPPITPISQLPISLSKEFSAGKLLGGAIKTTKGINVGDFFSRIFGL